MFEIEKCGVTGKDRWAERANARRALAAHGYAKGSRKVHFCVFCSGYHLTKGRRGRPGKGK